MCMYKQDLALNNLQCLICHKTKPNIHTYTRVYIVANELNSPNSKKTPFKFQ